MWPERYICAGPGVFVLFGVSVCCVGSVDPVFARGAYDRALVFFVAGNALRAYGTRVNFGWSRIALNLSGKCNEEEYD